MNLLTTIFVQMSMLLTFGSADVLVQYYDNFVPGFKVEQIFVPPNCDYHATDGDYMYQHYQGNLDDGTKFDASYDRGTTFNFHLGMGEVIKGIDMGMRGMCKGEKRTITIPPELGYGNRPTASGSIPAGSTLHFFVVLADIKPSGLKIETLYMPEDCTRRSAAGDFISEHYNGTFTDGKPFDSSYDRDQTYDFTLGEGQVIKGVDLGLSDMCEGERRRLTIPSILAYGRNGYEDVIPPDATIMFDVELVEIGSGKLKWYKTDGPSCHNDNAVAQHDVITVLYSGFTESEFKFTNGKEPYTFTVGDINVLVGLNQGVIGMCIGEKRQLRIPPKLANGDINNAGVPANVRITIDIELVDAEHVFKTINTNNDSYLNLKEVEEWIVRNPEFADDIKDNEDYIEKLKSYYFKKKDLNKDGYLSRTEFYKGGPSQTRDEL